MFVFTSLHDTIASGARCIVCLWTISTLSGLGWFLNRCLTKYYVVFYEATLKSLIDRKNDGSLH